MIHYRKEEETNILKKDSDGVYHDINTRTPLALNTYRLDLYQSDWKIEKIALFELFIVLSMIYGKVFYYQKERFLENLRLSDHAYRKYRRELENAGFINIKPGNKKNNFKNRYSVNFDCIINNIEEIYHFNQFDNKFINEAYKNDFVELFEHYKNKVENLEDSQFPYIYNR
ncbi:MAG: hypothetical protein HUJ22_02190 [Gracilimonas sp.]|uniref:hypothetical protein n=1 Tax=Gracilimonas sp. TaxID=1974203 RepID=UPI0019952BDD|nr:hypothetical protein [Gracilimonas sp.]MBD3615354.1 hypothetical protein [Gracilimonas sp.]